MPPFLLAKREGEEALCITDFFLRADGERVRPPPSQKVEASTTKEEAK